jgi:hypothetical protein
MPALVASIRVLGLVNALKTWMAGTSPAMTSQKRYRGMLWGIARGSRIRDKRRAGAD